ncbi:hypothetical protein MAPG_08750 [Magnaporthiopsis poae ATCC 64411]|uniref:Heterokaryon incompatibility domain-containing protein n=1 Tax=Magnaporthiopsis poae (strain ATCC 64411 / 73-15) TaxID=644358 RepID=A0A0C4E860_MAGP6|nr:hypothetical protein MAPG_08750 [Magnaporthiopsis poae ATCC 64411]
MDGTSSTVVGEFRYTPLPSANCTRVLELLPATDPSDELRCNLKAVDLEKDCSPYEALSYTWGDGSPTHRIYMRILEDNKESWAALPITENLWTALRRFRRRSKVRVIWADAVCINQGDVEEKDFQIPGMVDIYRSATRVLVWLGSDGDKEKAMARLGVLGHRILRRESTLSARELDELASCASALLSMPWFSRRWIIQEVVFSPDVALFVGAERTSFFRLVAIIKLLPRPQNQSPSKSTESFLAIYQIWRQKMSGELSRDCGLLRLMRVFDHFGCVDPVDRIFTIAPLAQDVEFKLLSTSGSRNRKLKLVVRPLPTASSPHALPNPDYGSVAQIRGMELSYGAAPEQVFTRFAEFLAHSGNFIWTLGQALARADGAARPSGLPSWVPDWRNPQRRQPLWIEGRNEKGPHVAFSEANPYEELLTRYHDRLIYQNAIPSCPVVARRSDGNGHRLRAAVCHIEYWPSTTLDQCVKDWNSNMWPVLRATDLDKLRMTVTPLRHDMLFPLSVAFKTKPFPERNDLPGVVGWIRESFLSLLSHVLQPWQLSIFMAAETGPERWSGLPGRYLERFAFVITAGGMFAPGVSGTEQAGLVRDGKDGCTRVPLGLSDSYPGTGLDDPDLQSEHWPDPGKLGFSPLDPASLVPILAPIIDKSKGDEPPMTPLLRLISTTMTGRCVISCDYVISKDPYLERELDSNTMRVLGITSPHTASGDRITSFHDAIEDGHDNVCYSWRPSPEQDWLAAPSAVQSDGSVSGDSIHLPSSTTISFSRFGGRPPRQKYWTRTYAVRPQCHQADGGEGVEQEVWFENFDAEEGRSEYLCSRINMPRLEFVGDCFLSTLRWEPDLLRWQSLDLADIWTDLEMRWYTGRLNPQYKIANSAASVLEFHLV